MKRKISDYFLPLSSSSESAPSTSVPRATTSQPPPDCVSPPPTSSPQPNNLDIEIVYIKPKKIRRPFPTTATPAHTSELYSPD